MRDRKEYVVLTAGQVRAIVSSTNATPIVVTCTGHGFSTGDRVTINNHATNTAANGTWTATRLTADTFSLDGSVGNGVGGATGCAALAGKVLPVEDYRTIVMSFNTDGGGDAAMTVKLAGSIGKSATDSGVPDFAKAQSASNSFDFIEMADYQSSSVVIAGDTGFVVASADDHRTFEANINGLKYVSLLATAGTQGELTVKAVLFN